MPRAADESTLTDERVALHGADNPEKPAGQRRSVIGCHQQGLLGGGFPIKIAMTS